MKFKTEYFRRTDVNNYFQVRLPKLNSFFFRLDWQREDEEKFEALAIPKSACRLISSAYHSFRVSVDKKFSPNVFNRELIFSFFCIKTKGQRK
jgi:hypothetical protein